MMEMGTKYLITTDFPTPEQIAEWNHIPPERVAELNRQIAAIREKESKKRLATSRRKQSAKKK